MKIHGHLSSLNVLCITNTNLNNSNTHLCLQDKVSLQYLNYFHSTSLSNILNYTVSAFVLDHNLCFDKYPKFM